MFQSRRTSKKGIAPLEKENHCIRLILFIVEIVANCAAMALKAVTTSCSHAPSPLTCGRLSASTPAAQALPPCGLFLVRQLSLSSIMGASSCSFAGTSGSIETRSSSTELHRRCSVSKRPARRTLSYGAAGGRQLIE